MAKAPNSKASPNLTRLSSTWLKHISRFNLAILLLLYVTSLHLIGLYTFTKGFLLTRSTISTVSSPYTVDNYHDPDHSSGRNNDPTPIPPTHSKAVILVIDALRTDFISPHYPSPSSPYHHGIFTLPAELSKAQPDHSIIYNTYSDPPTSSMQRLKAIVTGSLPTFIDVGSNFASPAIDEDSFVSQLVAHNKSVWFMGDDTWVSLFPDLFNRAYPYDSFNVEDLHTVDNGIIEHLMPSLHPENSTKWDVLIGHFLGVDHVGHRVGPHRDVMQKKLRQMDRVLRDVVDRLDDDTLLVVLGDHGMDQKGNHGGDSVLETAAGMWIYSKGKPLTTTLHTDSAISAARREFTFPGTTTPLRHIDQIDITPTISMMLGIPIPFNNLGSVIPECFGDITTLEAATRANSEQIKRYVSKCGNEQVEQYLKPAWTKAADTISSNSGSEAQLAKSINTHRRASLQALARLRALWAEFSVPFMSLGLAILGLSLPTLWALYTGVKNNNTAWDLYARLALETAMMSGVVGGGICGLITMLVSMSFTLGIQIFFAAFALSTEITLILPLCFNTPRPSLSSITIERAIGTIIVVLHSLSFASNSFIDWEDRIVVFFFATIMIIYLIKGFTAPTTSMRMKIAGLASLAAILVRLVGTITICREEQHPYCRVTFFAGLTPTAPTWVLVTFVPLATQLPRLIGYVLGLSRSNAGPAPTYINVILRTALTLNSVYWLFEWLESWQGLNPDRIPLVGIIKLWIARSSFAVLILALPYKWIASSLCIEIKRDTAQVDSEGAVTVFGFANTFGSTYILFYLIPFAMIHLVSLPTAQVALSALLVAHLAYIELVDTRRDAIIMKRSFANSGTNPGAFDASSTTSIIVQPSFTDIVPLVLMGFIGFFATGHQAVLTSIQWKSAFVGLKSVTYPWSPLYIILNSFGPLALSAFFIPLLTTWNISPRPQSTIPVLAHTLQLVLAFLMYHTALAFASALSAAWLRRHLMVWKIFAPRFMLGGITLVVVDLSVLIAVGVGLRVTSWKVWKTFKCESV
jgi:phosphatidylinositol glycan class O